MNDFDKILHNFQQAINSTNDVKLQNLQYH